VFISARLQPSRSRTRQSHGLWAVSGCELQFHNFHSDVIISLSSHKIYAAPLYSQFSSYFMLHDTASFPLIREPFFIIIPGNASSTPPISTLEGYLFLDVLAPWRIFNSTTATRNRGLPHVATGQSNESFTGTYKRYSRSCVNIRRWIRYRVQEIIWKSRGLDCMESGKRQGGVYICIGQGGPKRRPPRPEIGTELDSGEYLYLSWRSLSGDNHCRICWRRIYSSPNYSIWRRRLCSLSTGYCAKSSFPNHNTRAIRTDLFPNYWKHLSSFEFLSLQLTNYASCHSRLCML